MEARDKHSVLTAGRLREILSYDPMTGAFTWLCVKGRGKVGARADRLHKTGYRIVKIDNTAYYAHRLAWLYATGNWPKEMLDHASMDKADNRITNLREATRAQNNANRAASTGSASGIKGVYPAGKRWTAMIRANGTLRYLGTFTTSEEAQTAYAEAASDLFGQFARTA